MALFYKRKKNIKQAAMSTITLLYKKALHRLLELSNEYILWGFLYYSICSAHSFAR